MVVAMTLVAYLLTYPYQVLLIGSLIYLAFIPVSWRRFHIHDAKEEKKGEPAADVTSPQLPGQTETPAGSARVVEIRGNDKR
jgi:CDP-diacylglycerol--serine O-phosphatidyltransferase